MYVCVYIYIYLYIYTHIYLEARGININDIEVFFSILQSAGGEEQDQLDVSTLVNACLRMKVESLIQCICVCVCVYICISLSLSIYIYIYTCCCILHYSIY